MRGVDYDYEEVPFSNSLKHKYWNDNAPPAYAQRHTTSMDDIIFKYVQYGFVTIVLLFRGVLADATNKNGNKG